MGERKLASVQRVESISPIEGADAIETARVLGWDVIVRKDLNYQPGDSVVFFEIDSVLPDLPVFEEMLKGKPWSPRAARLKTIKLRGQLSQGYVRHLVDVIDPVTLEEADDNGSPFEVGDDVTDLIGVTKYEPPLPTDTAAISGHWIPGVPKTDEERVQSSPKLLAALQGRPYVITVKLDGMSGTFGCDADGVFWACSRNFRLKPGHGAHWHVAGKYPLMEKYLTEHPHLYIQGEVVGPGIQGNKLALHDADLFVFNVLDIKNGVRYLPFSEMVALAHSLGMKVVPIEERGASFRYTQDELLKMAEGKYPSGKEREGIVIRDRYDTTPSRISFKAISNRFLLKGGDD